MTIESKLHLEGVREQIRRLNDLMDTSARFLDEHAMSLLTMQVKYQIGTLELAIREYKGKVTSPEWQTLSVPIEVAPIRSRFTEFCTKTIVLTSPLRQTANRMKQKPAHSAGFCFA